MTHTTGTAARTGSPTRSSWSVLARRPLGAWRGVDLVVGAVLAVALGVVFWGWDTFLYPFVDTASKAYLPIASLALGVWLLPAVLGGLLIRRPGAAVYVEVVAATVEALLGNKWAWLVLLSGLLQGLGVEIALALWRWRRFDLVAAVLGGMLAAVLEICCYEWWSYVPDLAWVHKVVYLAFGMVSGAVVAGLGGVALERALGRSGAVDAFPAAQEAREARAR